MLDFLFFKRHLDYNHSFILIYIGKKMKKTLTLLAGCISMLYATSTLAAGNISGTLNVRLVIGNGCVVSGGSTSGSTNDFGTLDFGTHSALSSIITAQSSGTGGANIQLTCSLALPYTVSLDGGANYASSSRNMIASSTLVQYQLYQDSAHLLPWPVNTGIGGVGTGIPVNLTVYGVVPNQTTPAAGTYLDQVNVTVNW